MSAEIAGPHVDGGCRAKGGGSPAERVKFVVELVLETAAPPRTREDLLRAITERFGVGRKTAWSTLNDVLGERPPRVAVRGGRFLPAERAREFVAADDLARRELPCR